MERKYRRGSPNRQDRSKKRRYQFTFENEILFTSTSAKKLNVSRDQEVHVNINQGYLIIEFFLVFSTLFQLVICKEYKGQVKFSEFITRGLGFKISMSYSYETAVYAFVSICRKNLQN